MTHWLRLVISEFIGTALLIAVGCSFVVVDFAPGSPIVHTIINPGLRRAITGFLFGTTGGLIALSKVGKESGAHINPIVTLAFWMQRKISGKLALLYALGQCAGAIVGAYALSLWGLWAHSTHFAATIPGPSGNIVAAIGEILASFCLIVGLFLFLGHPKLRRFTPALFAPLYAVMVYLEAPLSGTSTNPARSLGPEVVSHLWLGWWVYWVGPTLGSLMGVILMAWFMPLIHWEVRVAKLYYFQHDPYGVFHRSAKSPRQPSTGA